MDAIRRRRPVALTRLIRYGWVGFCMLLLVACHQDMYEQAKYRPLDPSTFFADGRASRPPVQGAVIAGQVKTDEYFFTGLVNGEEGTEMPFPVTQEVINRGQEKFNIYCSPCHGLQGNGHGMVSQRGAITAANFHDVRFIDPESPSSRVGHFFNVMTNGYRYMYPYASRVEPADRWAIAAYIRALQLSQNATVNDVPPDERAKLN